MMAVILLLVGLCILVAEVFLPSGGILAVCTILTLTVSAICAYNAWYIKYPAAWYGYLCLLLVTIPSAIGGAFYLLPRTPMGKRVFLEAPSPEAVEPHVAETARLLKLVGEFGKTVTMLNPGGMVLVRGQRLHAFSEGLMVDPGISIEVLEVRGSRLLVREGTPPEVSDPSTAHPPDPGIDFELPAEG
jgi:membrane-bound ClpP family serine protease